MRATEDTGSHSEARLTIQFLTSHPQMASHQLFVTEALAGASKPAEDGMKYWTVRVDLRWIYALIFRHDATCRYVGI